MKFKKVWIVKGDRELSIFSTLSKALDYEEHLYRQDSDKYYFVFSCIVDEKEI